MTDIVEKLRKSKSAGAKVAAWKAILDRGHGRHSINFPRIPIPPLLTS